jgi:hypothetical protein
MKGKVDMAKANDTFKPVLVATPKTEMIFVKLLQEATYEGINKDTTKQPC